MPMTNIDYACGINCPDDYDDERMLMEFVISDDCELCYLDTFMKETFLGKDPEGKRDDVTGV